MIRKMFFLCSFIAAIIFMSACSSSPYTADISGVWGVVISQESMVSDNDPSKTGSISSCDTGWSSSDPGAGIELWNVTQTGSDFTATDAANPASVTPLATGFWSKGKLIFEGTTGTWSAEASVRAGACCFDAVGSDGRHWHAIKMTGISTDGGVSDECQTGKNAWEAGLISVLESGSNLISTSAGEVEYAIWGDSGPYVIVFHGGQGGYDQIRAFSPGIIGKGYRIITWSRPGYLRTPLPLVSTPDDQADMAAALLDALGIDRVAAIGGSAGGPPLFSFALRHPNRLWALIAESAVSQTYMPRSDFPYVNELVYMFTNPGGMWIFNSMFEFATEGTLRIFLRTVSTLNESSFNLWVA